LAEAIEIYKALHTVSHAGPNTNTFNILFRGCHRSARKELAMFFANEMIQLGLEPDRITYDRLILVCLQAGDLEDALLYYEEMTSTPSKKGKMKPRRLTWELLIHKCVVQGDERAVAIWKSYKAGVEEPRRAVEKAVVDRFEYGIITPTEIDGGRAQNEESVSTGVENPHVTPAEEVGRSPGTGADTELSEKSSGVAPQGSDLNKDMNGEKISGVGARDGLAQLMEASKSTKPY
jgi:pentatricopeptide repeat protein